MKNKITKKLINDNWDDFLSMYYLQECPGCPDGHSSFWKTVIESKEWKAWKEHNFKISEHGNYDWPECEELGIMSEGHWGEFVEFLKNYEK